MLILLYSILSDIYCHNRKAGGDEWGRTSQSVGITDDETSKDLSYKLLVVV